MAQIIQNLKNQEDSAHTIVEEEMEKMKEQLDRKEYVLQQLESKTYHYEKYLQRKSLVDKEASSLLHKFQDLEPLKEQKVTNVIEDNVSLRNELKEAFKEVNKLQRLNLKKKQANDELKEKIETMKQEHAKAISQSPEKKKPTSPRI